MLGGVTSIDGITLGFSYEGSAFVDDSVRIYWYPELETLGGIYCAAMVRCEFVDGIFSNSDTCQIVGLPPKNVVCLATVKNGTQKEVETSVATSATVSTVATTKHVTDEVKFKICFGPEGY